MSTPILIKKITIVGAGNVATNLGMAFADAGLEIAQVFSRNEVKAKKLASKFNCHWTNEVSKISDGSDLYLISVTDNIISEVANNLPNNSGIIVHTSGSQPMDALNGITNNFGVFYPPQTMTLNKKMSFADIPICIEGSNKSTLDALEKLAEKISNIVVKLNSDQRLYLHLTAVTVNNFSNLLYSYAHDLLNEKDIDFRLLLPLIEETALKVRNTHPDDAQTGPARRKDEITINHHIKLLESHPDLQEIYSIFSKKLIKKYHEKL